MKVRFTTARGEEVEAEGAAGDNLLRLAQAEPAWQVAAWPHCRAAFEPAPAEAVDAKRGLLALPPLLKAYLRTGARFGHAAVLDRQFGTTDVFAVMPMSGVSATKVRYVGMVAMTISATPKARAAPTTSRSRVLVRRAASSDPTIEPSAIVEPRMPYSPAPWA